MNTYTGYAEDREIDVVANEFEDIDTRELVDITEDVKVLALCLNENI